MHLSTTQPANIVWSFRWSAKILNRTEFVIDIYSCVAIHHVMTLTTSRNNGFSLLVYVASIFTA